MKVFVQADKRNMPYSVNGYLAMDGANQMGFETILFQDLEAITQPLHREDLFIGGIGTVRHRLAQLGIDAKEINYPEEIRKYLGRKLWWSHIDTINAHPEDWPLFVKSVSGKRITGKVIQTPKDMIGLGSYYENPEVICSEVVDFVAEWRAYVRYGQILDVRPYYGDWHYHYDPNVITACLQDYNSQPMGFSLDFGVTKTNQTLLIEVNEGYSLGAYGLMAIPYTKLLAARWAEMTETEDECAFDLGL